MEITLVSKSLIDEVEMLSKALENSFVLFQLNG